MSIRDFLHILTMILSKKQGSRPCTAFTDSHAAGLPVIHAHSDVTISQAQAPQVSGFLA